MEGPSRIGVEIGLGYVMQSGTYYAGCGTFEHGARLNADIAAAYDLLVADHLRVEGLLGFCTKSVHESYNSVESLTLTIPDNDPLSADVEFENVGDARFSQVYVQPSVKYYLTTGFYAGAGVNAGLKLSATTQFTKNIVTQMAVVDQMGLTEFYYDEGESSDRYSKVFPAEERADAPSLVFDGVFYVGAEIHAGKKLLIGPRVQYSLPLTVALDKPELKLSSLQLSIGARYPLE